VPPVCEYHDCPLDGPEGTCPQCTVEQAEHEARCTACRTNPNLPDEGGLDIRLATGYRGN